jgi:hypothetical protein
MGEAVNLRARYCNFTLSPKGARMHVAAVPLIFVSLLGQVGGDYGGSGYGDSSASDLSPPMTVTSGAPRTRSTRVRASGSSSSSLGGSYPPASVAISPRYADSTASGASLPPVGNSDRMAQEDPQSLLADKVLRDLIQPARNDQDVRSLRLLDALERTSGSQQQFAAIKEYWDWTLAVCELYGVVEEDAILSRVTAPRTQHDQAAHVANRKASASRLEDSRLDVAAKVVDLLEATGLRTTSTLRPADVPFVGVYNTNFSKIFPGQTAPVSLKKIHQTLPYALKVVRSRADSYESARQAVAVARDAYQANQCPYDDFANALTQMRSQRRAFLDAVHDYNFAIAEYALSIAGPGLERQTVVSMLIRTASQRPYRGASLDRPGDVLPVSGIEDLDSGSYSTYLVSPDEASVAAPPARLGDQPVRRQLHSVLVR